MRLTVICQNCEYISDPIEVESLESNLVFARDFIVCPVCGSYNKAVDEVLD